MMQTARLAGKTAIRLWLRQRRSVALPPPAIGEIRARLRALEACIQKHESDQDRIERIVAAGLNMARNGGLHTLSIGALAAKLRLDAAVVEQTIGGLRGLQSAVTAAWRGELALYLCASDASGVAALRAVFRRGADYLLRYPHTPLDAGHAGAGELQRHCGAIGAQWRAAFCDALGRAALSGQVALPGSTHDMAERLLSRLDTMRTQWAGQPPAVALERTCARFEDWLADHRRAPSLAARRRKPAPEPGFRWPDWLMQGHGSADGQP